jgi:Rps23 Pro-64 3,4-dihydroxylase Tpa1-like proline 4-hydroxylase
MKAMSGVFNIPKLLPDSYFTGGGLNVTQRGGLLDVHVDGNYYDALGLNRRLNALVYLNPNYKKNWGGEFGIYDNTGEVLVKKVEPILIV